jgi:2-oxoisovalerate dehydrogenase E2 component (dihydrolipoyl transacylase)
MPTIVTNEVTMPQLGESVNEGTIGTWLREIGDTIEKYDPLVEVESDKASAELPSPLAGTLVEILVEPGTTVAVGTPLCRIEDIAAPPAAAPDVPAPSNGHANGDHRMATRAVDRTDEMTLLRTRSSPYVRRKADELGIDLARIEGSGAGGRVTKHDVLAYAEQMEQPDHPPTTRRADLVSAASATADTPGTPAPTRQPIDLHEGDEAVPVTAMRRAIAETMTRSMQTIPQATVVMEVDMTPVVAWRAARKDAFREREGIDLTYLPIVLEAVARTLREFPRLNAAWDEDRIIHRREINLGVAVALEDGLVVPVIRNADRLSRTGLAHAVAELAGRARAGSLTPDEMSGGTFTVNNPGTFGSLVSTPILVPGQVAILSTEAIIKRPVVVDDMIGIRSMMNLSMTIDHRALDGLGATRFLQAVKQRLEGFIGDD